MKRSKNALRRGAWLGCAGAFALAAAPVRAMDIAPGDLIVIFVKSGFEKIVNVGDLDTFPGGGVNLSGELNIPQFGNSAADAKLVALRVADPLRTVDFGFGDLTLHNVTFSTPDTSLQLTDPEIEGSMNIVDLDGTTGSTAWFSLLRSVSEDGVAEPDGTVGTATTVLTPVANSFSYESKLGLTTDRIANNLTGVDGIATVVDGDGFGEADLWEAQRGYADFGGPDMEVEQLGTLSVEGGTLFFVPEPGQVAMHLAAMLTLGVVVRTMGRVLREH